MNDLTCGNCGKRFKRPNRRGPVPRWCSAACRQAMHRKTTNGNHDEKLEWFDEYDGLWLMCSCGHEAYLGREPMLRDVIAVGRQHQHTS